MRSLLHTCIAVYVSMNISTHMCMYMYNVSELQDLPPVRSHAGPGSSTTATAGGKKKKRRKKNNSSGSEKRSGAKQSTRIRSYDYKAWDKFDVVG